MNHILYLTDFSESAENAFPIALDFASKTGAELHVLHALDTARQYINLSMASTGDLGMPGVEPDIVMESINVHRKDAEQSLSELVERGADRGVSVSTVIGEGSMLEDMEAFCELNQPDLIILGTHGASGFKEAFIGSNAQKLVRNASVPVLTVSEKIKSWKSGCVVYASDFAEENLNATLPQLKLLADAFGSEVHLLYVNTPAYFEETEETLSRITQVQKKYGLDKAIVYIQNDFTVENGVLTYARKVGATSVAITTHGFKGLRKFFSDNVTETIVNHADLPVLCLPQD